MYSIREAATHNLQQLAQEFGSDWAKDHLVPQVRTFMVLVRCRPVVGNERAAPIILPRSGCRALYGDFTPCNAALEIAHLLHHSSRRAQRRNLCVSHRSVCCVACLKHNLASPLTSSFVQSSLDASAGAGDDRQPALLVPHDGAERDRGSGARRHPRRARQQHAARRHQRQQGQGDSQPFVFTSD